MSEELEKTGPVYLLFWARMHNESPCAVNLWAACTFISSLDTTALAVYKMCQLHSEAMRWLKCFTSRTRNCCNRVRSGICRLLLLVRGVAWSKLKPLAHIAVSMASRWSINLWILFVIIPIEAFEQLWTWLIKQSRKHEYLYLLTKHQKSHEVYKSIDEKPREPNAARTVDWFRIYIRQTFAADLFWSCCETLIEWRVWRFTILSCLVLFVVRRRR